MEIQHLKGAVKENPGRFPSNVPKSSAQLGDPPSDLNEKEVELWKDIVGALPAGICTRLDRVLLKHTVRLCVYVDNTPIAELSASKFGMMVQCLARLGFTPADRRRLGSNEPSSTYNEFDQFLA